MIGELPEFVLEMITYTSGGTACMMHIQKSDMREFFSRWMSADELHQLGIDCLEAENKIRESLEKVKK